MDKISNFDKQYGKPASLMIIFVIWLSIFSMIVSVNTGDLTISLFPTVFAQKNQTGVGDVQKVFSKRRIVAKTGHNKR